MKQIAYKRADNPQSKVQNHLPDDFITEWKEVQPGESPPAEEGWRMVPEDQFLKLIAKTNDPANIDKFMKAKEAAVDAKFNDPDRKTKGT